MLLLCGDARATTARPGPTCCTRCTGACGTFTGSTRSRGADWDTTDSRIGEYSRDCDTVTEVRNLRELSAWVDTLL